MAWLYRAGVRAGMQVELPAFPPPEWIKRHDRDARRLSARHAGRCPARCPARRSAQARPGERQAVHQDPRLPDERVRLGQDGRRARRQRWPGTDRYPGRRRRHPGQHLFHPREGAGEGVQPAGRLEGPEEQGPRGHHRRGRLRCLAGRRGDHQACAVRGPCVRPADPAPAAGADPRPTRAEAPAGGHQLPRDREVRPPAGTACRRRFGVRVDHGRLLEVLLVLRGALHPRHRSQPPVRGRGGGSGAAGRAGRARNQPARAERQCLSRPLWRWRVRRSRPADPDHRRDRRRRPHPLHHLAPAGVQRFADRCVPRRAAAGQLPAPAGAGRQRPRTVGDEARLYRAGIQVEDPQAARGAPGHLDQLGLHRRLPRRNRCRFREDHEADRGHRLRPQLLLHLFAPPGHPGGRPGGHDQRCREARAPVAPAGAHQCARRRHLREDGRHRADRAGGRPFAQEPERTDRQDREHAFGELPGAGAADRPVRGCGDHRGADQFAARAWWRNKVRRPTVGNHRIDAGQRSAPTGVDADQRSAPTRVDADRWSACLNPNACGNAGSPGSSSPR